MAELVDRNGGNRTGAGPNSRAGTRRDPEPTAGRRARSPDPVEVPEPSPEDVVVIENGRTGRSAEDQATTVESN